MNQTKSLLTGALVLVALLLTSCREDPPELSEEADILSFRITRAGNPQLSKDYAGIVDKPNLYIALFFDEDDPSGPMVPTIEVSPGATVFPASGTAVDFSKPVSYTVTAPSGARQTYTVTVSTPAAIPIITGIRINNVPCQADAATGRFFYPVRAGGNPAVTLLCIGQNISGFTAAGITAGNNSTVTLPGWAPGAALEITPVGKTGKKGDPVRLILTSLPVVHVEVGGPIADKPKTECVISLLDPSGKTNDSLYYFAPHRAGIETRGGLAQQFPKKSYSFEFRLPTGDEEVEGGTKLLGMRDDGDWILDAMYIDHARMRNRLSTDLWTSINRVPHISKEPGAINGTRGQFVELFINNSYHGLYCLTERVDRKQLQLNKKQGYSYKASQWSSSTEFYSGDASYNNNTDTWDGWELEYQAENGAASSPQVKWEPLRNFIRYTSLSGNADFSAQIATRIDMANLVDYLLFINVIGADDNNGKNTYFSYAGNGWEKFFITPWDLDASWGRKWEGSRIDLRAGEFIGVTGVPHTDSRYCRPNGFFIRMMETNPGGFRTLLKNRWQELRQGDLSLTALTARVEAYRKLLDTSGAFTREKQKWPEKISDLDTETTYMLSWIETRLAQMDQYLGNL